LEQTLRAYAQSQRLGIDVVDVTLMGLRSDGCIATAKGE